MKKYWVGLGLLFLLVSCSQTRLERAEEVMSASTSVQLGLSTTQAQPGETVTVSLEGLYAAGFFDIEPATITVAVGNQSATILSANSSLVSFSVPNLASGSYSVLVSGQAQYTYECPPPQYNCPIPLQAAILRPITDVFYGYATLAVLAIAPSFTLNPPSATYGEEVTATLTGFSATEVNFIQAETSAEIMEVRDNTLVFKVPTNLEGGITPVQIGSVTQGLEILNPLEFAPTPSGNPEFVAMVVQGKTRDNVLEVLSKTTTELQLSAPLELIDYRDLNPGAINICGAAIATIRVSDITKLGAVRQKLEADVAVINKADPRSLWGGGQANTPTHLNAIAAQLAHGRGRTGSGVTIAVLDSGVDTVDELANRVTFLGDFTGQGNSGDGGIDGVLHGTAVSVLAAGAYNGVAPRASVVSARVCDTQGNCYTDDVIAGLCQVLSQVADKNKLVINMSLGGKYSSRVIKNILQEVTLQGTLVAISAGNNSEDARQQFPAAYAKEIPGVVSVGSLKLPGAPTERFWVRINDKATNPWDTTTGQVLTWTTLQTQQENGATYTKFGSDYQVTSEGITSNPYTGDTPLSASLSILCISKEGLPAPIFAPSSGFGSWSGGRTFLTQAVPGTTLSSRGVADAKCAEEASMYGLSGAFQMAEFHDGTGWSFWALNAPPYTSLPGSSFSNHGNAVELWAPGENITLATLSGNTSGGTFAGTSFAAPLVAGAMALWREANPAASAAEIELYMLEAKANRQLDLTNHP